MFKQFQETLTFDDVLLVPQKSKILPSDAVLKSKLTNKLSLDLPFIAAPMDTVCESKMALAMASAGAMGVVHKNMSIADQAKEIKKIVKGNSDAIPAGATGVGEAGFERAKALYQAGAKVVIVDTAHGHSKGVIETVKNIKKKLKGLEVIAGNIATGEAAKDLITAGADAVKVGIGPGSICTTRVVAGIGVPQLSAIIEVSSAMKKLKKRVPIIADGGIKSSGDIVKALAAGASTVMMGNMFAGTDEAPGKIVTTGGQKLKLYRGMGSLDAMEKGSKDRYGQAGVTSKKKFVPEGVSGAVVYKGSVEAILYQLAGGLRSGMGYNGAKTIAELQKKAIFIRITGASLRENHPHDMARIDSAPNYSV